MILDKGTLLLFTNIAKTNLFNGFTVFILHFQGYKALLDNGISKECQFCEWNTMYFTSVQQPFKGDQLVDWSSREPASSFTQTLLFDQTLEYKVRVEFWKALQIRVELRRPYQRHKCNLLEGRRTVHGDMGMFGTLIVQPPFHTLISLNMLRRKSCANSQNKTLLKILLCRHL